MSEDLIITQKMLSEIEFQSLEDAVGYGMQIREQIDKFQWVLGDYAIIVERDLGPVLDDVARDLGIDRKTLRRYRDVARRFPPPLREKFMRLSWTHFKFAAPQPNAEEWLEKADDGEWSTDELYMQIRELGKKTPPPVDRPHLVECLNCGGWFMIKGKQCPTQGKCVAE